MIYRKTIAVGAAMVFLGVAACAAASTPIAMPAGSETIIAVGSTVAVVGVALLLAAELAASFVGRQTDRPIPASGACTSWFDALNKADDDMEVAELLQQIMESGGRLSEVEVAMARNRISRMQSTPCAAVCRELLYEIMH